MRSRTGYTVRLEPSKPQQIGWVPDDRRAAEIDLQIQILNVEGDWEDLPRVLWRMQQGHGGLTYNVPRLGPVDGGSTQPGYDLPARGVRERLATRELYLNLELTNADEDDVGAVVVQVTMQPAHSAGAIVSPKSDCNLHSPVPNVLPIGATELRFCNPTSGLAIAAGPTVRFLDLFAGVLSTPTAVSFADWRPIPTQAAFWVPDSETGVPMQVVYR